MNSPQMDCVLMPTSAPVAATSIFQLCLGIIDRLHCVPDFDPYLEVAEKTLQKQEEETDSKGLSASITNFDPVSLVWAAFRQGYSLCALYNVLDPSNAIKLEPVVDRIEVNTAKKAIYHFLMACKDNLNYSTEELFAITDLFKDDTNSFVKVLKTADSLLDRIEEKGLLVEPKVPSVKLQMSNPSDNRAKVVMELLETERKYIADLETLQAYMQECSQRKVISPETIRYLFANLHSLVDFQRRFLIGLEANAILPPEDQRIGALFLSMEEGFACYEPFCANYNTASDIALRETPNLQALAHIVEPTYGLPSLLIKPIQRICKYPLLMKSLIQYTKEDEYPYYSELLDAMAAIERVAGKVNEIKRKEENLEVVKSFSKKTINITDEIVDTWGELLQHDRFEVITKDQKPREMFVYLFKEVLVCSRDLSDKGKKRKDSTHGGKKIEETLEIRGQINMSSVMKVLEKTSDSGDLFIRLFWKEEEVQILIIKCRNEEQRSKWITNLQDIITEKKLLKQQSLKAEAEHLKSIAPLPAPPTSFNDDEVPHIRRSHGNYSHGLKNMDSPTPLSPQHLQFRNRSASSPNIHPARTPNPTSSPLAQNGREYSNQLPTYSSRPTSNDNLVEQYHSEHHRNGSSYNNGGDSGLPNGNLSHSNGHSNGSVKPPSRPQIKLKINYLDDVFVIMVPSDIQYPDLLVRVERKIRLCGGRRGQTYPTPDIEDGFRLRYKDEDDDPITINSQEDVHMAFESASQSQSGHPATNPSLQFPSVTLYVD